MEPSEYPDSPFLEMFEKWERRLDAIFDRAAPVAEWLRSLTSVLLIIRSSHRCGFAPRTGHEFICETSHVLLAGVSGGFSPGTPVFAPPTD